VLRAIKAGRISGQRDATGGWEIDPAVFHRVFPPLPTAPAASAQQINNRSTLRLPYFATWLSSFAGTWKPGTKIIVDASKTCGRIVTTGAKPSKLRRNLMPE
jgi:hypothetical protein